MSKTTILVVCAFAGAILLGTTTFTSADYGDNNGIPDRVSALESALADQADELSELTDLIEYLEQSLAKHDHDADYVGAPAESLAIVKGVVVTSGFIINGKGFTVMRAGEAEYEVAFDPGTFSSQPAVFVQAIGPAPEIAYLGLPVTAEGFRVLISTNVAHGFKFIAIGGQ